MSAKEKPAKGKDKPKAKREATKAQTKRARSKGKDSDGARAESSQQGEGSLEPGSPEAWDHWAKNERLTLSDAICLLAGGIPLLPTVERIQGETQLITLPHGADDLEDEIAELTQYVHNDFLSLDAMGDPSAHGDYFVPFAEIVVWAQDKIEIPKALAKAMIDAERLVQVEGRLQIPPNAKPSADSSGSATAEQATNGPVKFPPPVKVEPKNIKLVIEITDKGVEVSSEVRGCDGFLIEHQRPSAKNETNNEATLLAHLAAHKRVSLGRLEEAIPGSVKSAFYRVRDKFKEHRYPESILRFKSGVDGFAEICCAVELRHREDAPDFKGVEYKDARHGTTVEPQFDE